MSPRPASLGALLAAGAAAGVLLPGAARAEPAETAQAALLRAGFLADAPPPPARSTICIVDSGTDLTPDTRAAVIGRGNSLAGGSALDDVSPDKHGTYVTTTAVAARNGWGTVGIWPQGTVHVIQASLAELGGTEPSQESWTAGVRDCLRLDPLPTVISLSLASETADVAQIEQQVARAHVRGVSVVSAAGNGSGALDYPARVAGVLAVAAVSGDGGARCGFSDYAPGVLAAHGCGLESANGQGEPVLLQGTSFATPQVAAVLAALRAHRPDLSREGAEALLGAHARPGPDGLRIVDAVATFRAAGLGALVPAPSLRPAASAEPAPPPGAIAPDGSAAAPAPRSVSERGAAPPRPMIASRAVRALAVKVTVRPVPGSRLRARPQRLALHQNPRTVILRRGPRARRVGLELHGRDGTISLASAVRVPPLARPRIVRRRARADRVLITIRVPRGARLQVRPARGVRRLGRQRLAVARTERLRRMSIRIRAGGASSPPRAVRIPRAGASVAVVPTSGYVDRRYPTVRNR